MSVSCCYHNFTVEIILFQHLWIYLEIINYYSNQSSIFWNLDIPHLKRILNWSNLQIHKTKMGVVDGDDFPASSEEANGNGSGTGNCSNAYCEPMEDYEDRIRDFIFPQDYEWALIVAHCIVFVVGLVGNALVCVAVFRNTTMRTVTNYFIVNLAVADFLIILICQPSTVIWDVTQTWFFGQALCKLVLYFQVSIQVTLS